MMSLLPILERFRDFVLSQEVPQKLHKTKATFIYSHRGRYSLGILLDLVFIGIVLLHAVKTSPNSFISPLASTPLGALLFTRTDASTQNSITLPTGETIPMPNLQALFTKNARFKTTIVASAQDFMSLPPDSDERSQKELRLLKFLKDQDASAADILLALQASATRAARAWGMEELWVLRQESKLSQFNIFPLSETNIQWAQNHGIDPRILGIAIDTYGVTLKLVRAEPQLFFEADVHKANDSDATKYIPSPAVVARLQMSETSWPINRIIGDVQNAGMNWEFQSSEKVDRAFVNIGGVSAWDAINLEDDWFPSGHKDLRWIAQKLQNTTGLPYTNTVQQLPGSARGIGDGSGGAIGPQFMPINARLFMGWYDTANSRLNNIFPSPNPFNPWTGMIMTSLYLTSEFYHRQTDVNNVTTVVRPGYSLLTNAQSVYHPKNDPRMKALMKWNPLVWEAKAAVKAGEDYSSIWHSQNLHTMIAMPSDFN